MIILAQLASGSLRVSAAVLDRSAVRELMYRPEVVAPWLHYVLAAVAVTGAGPLLMLYSSSGDKQGDAPKEAAMLRTVAGVVLVASLLQLPIGVWLLTTLSNQSRTALMGESVLASLAFLAAMLVVFLLLGRLLKIALGEFAAGDLRVAAALMLMVVVLMSISTRYSRERPIESRQAVVACCEISLPRAMP